MSTPSFSEQHLHLVSFDIPIPVNYGGAIDIYYKIRSLSQSGIKIHLHCFQYGRSPDPELENYCQSVAYYPRKQSFLHSLNKIPYIVKTREAADLLQRLSEEPYPILFEGLHSCLYLDHKNLKERRKIVRTHNIEHDYYNNLARIENNPLKRIYFRKEAKKLLQFESILQHADGIAAISKKDQNHFIKKFPDKEITTVSAFHPFQKVEYTGGKGKFALYHGSLEVGENNQAALFLLTEVFQDLSIPLYIAGNKPSSELIERVSKTRHVHLKSDLTTEEIYQLVREAQVNILPTFQATGIKLKLLSALFIGRHCVVNTPMVDNTGLESLCVIADTPEKMKQQLKKLMETTFSEEESSHRQQELFRGGFTNQVNVEKLIAMLYPPEWPRA